MDSPLCGVLTMSDSRQMLAWGTTVAGAYSNSTIGIVSTLERSSLCGAPANESGFMDLGATITAEVRVRVEEALHVVLCDAQPCSALRLGLLCD